MDLSGRDASNMKKDTPEDRIKEFAWVGNRLGSPYPNMLYLGDHPIVDAQYLKDVYHRDVFEIALRINCDLDQFLKTTGYTKKEEK